VVPGGAAYRHDLERRLAPDCARAEPRQRVMAYRRGLRSPAARQHRWPLADRRGEATPEALQPLRRRARWDPAAGREALRHARVQHRADPAAGLVLDATGCRHKGRHSAGGARPSRGTAGQGAHGQLGGLLGSARPRGHVLLARELALPQAWTDAPARCRQAGIPAARRVATTPPLAPPLLARGFTAGGPAPWGTGASV
jgi:SRSO17 transposase